MPRLIEKSPCDGLLPVFEAGVTLSECAPERITSVAPLAGKDRAMRAVLRSLGLNWPAPGQGIAARGALIVWSGRKQAFLIGAVPDSLAGTAALTDQSDGWSRMRLDGVGVEAVLSRLVPLDLGCAAFPVGAVARTGLNQMTILLRRLDVDAFEIMVLRSMAGTAVRELHHAMQTCAARMALR